MAELMDTLNELLEQRTGQISSRTVADERHPHRFGQGSGGSSGGLDGTPDGRLGGERDR